MLWMMLALSIVLSAAFFMTDDGWRLLTATHPLVACFAALAFSGPCTATVRDGRTCWRWQSGAGLLAIAAALFLVVPGLSYALARREIAAHPTVGGLAANEIVVPGGRRITGFLVIPDGTAVPVQTPALTVSEFIKLIGYALLEHDVGPFVQEAIAKAPFAFIAAARIDDRDDRNQLGLYIAPPAMLEERDVWAWRCAFRQRATSEAPAYYLLEIISAKSLP
jgi:hypothetical protein